MTSESTHLGLGSKGKSSIPRWVLSILSAMAAAITFLLVWRALGRRLEGDAGPRMLPVPSDPTRDRSAELSPDARLVSAAVPAVPVASNLPVPSSPDPGTEQTPSAAAGEGQISPDPADGLVVDKSRAQPETKTKKRGSSPLFSEIAQTILLTILIFAMVRSVVQNFKVDGASMEPTLHSGQYLLVDKVSYLNLDSLPEPLQVVAGIDAASSGRSVFPFGGPQRGDIVVFRYPSSPDRDFIKRVIGLPGDTVAIDRGRVMVNGVQLQEDYIQAVPTYSRAPEVVPEGEYFVLGDNRPNSSDSHIWGYVPRANLIGKAWVSYWPPQQWGIVPNSGMAGSN